MSGTLRSCPACGQAISPTDPDALLVAEMVPPPRRGGAAVVARDVFLHRGCFRPGDPRFAEIAERAGNRSSRPADGDAES
ncbi:MAG: hypothetical protein HYY35_01110 [Deltaproteobacteria bacterium]|nr:hypothetical protein [Deltaproteobacteria bacterium]